MAYLNLDFGDGLIANFHVNWLSPVKVRSMIIGGSDHSLIYNDLDTSERIRVYDRGISTISDEEKHKSLISYRTGDMYSPNVSHDEPLSIVAADFRSLYPAEKNRSQTGSPDCASSGFWRRPNVASRRRAAGSSSNGRRCALKYAGEKNSSKFYYRRGTACRHDVAISSVGPSSRGLYGQTG